MKKLNVVLNYYIQQNSSKKDYAMSNAAANIKELISKLDLNVEMVPEDNLSMLTRLITSLKGSPLAKEEEKIIKEIINHKMVSK